MDTAFFCCSSKNREKMSSSAFLVCDQFAPHKARKMAHHGWIAYRTCQGKNGWVADRTTGGFADDSM